MQNGTLGFRVKLLFFDPLKFLNAILFIIPRVFQLFMAHNVNFTEVLERDTVKISLKITSITNKI